MKKVLKNIFASALPQIMNIITNLILPSMIILKFGSEINGLISSIKVIISYVSILVQELQQQQHKGYMNQLQKDRQM